jgi:hypothetical protein
VAAIIRDLLVVVGQVAELADILAGAEQQEQPQ